MLALLCLVTSSAAVANEDQERRVRSGLKMFRSILIADKDIGKKHNAEQGIDIVFIYDGNLQRAQDLARRFVRMGRGDKKGKIKDRPITVHIMSSVGGISQENIEAAGIFVVAKVSEDIIKEAADYGLQHNIVTYSPFKGDVENGIMSGLMIATRPKPYFNLATLNESQIRIKPFMLKVAEIYEPGS